MGITTASDFALSSGASQAIYTFNLENQNHLPTEPYYSSGGQLTDFFSPISGKEETISQKVESDFKILKIIDYITSCFDLTKDELATICKIQSRKTLYNWIDGISTPRASTMERLFDLFMIAKAWRQAKLPNDRKVLCRPVLQGKSIIDILKDDVLNHEKILFAGTRLILLYPFNKTVLKDPFA